MGLQEDAAKIKGDANAAQDFFVSFFKKFPQHQNSFPNYKGKSPDSLKTVPAFGGHVNKVVSKMCDVACKAGDAGAFKAEAATLAKMPQHKGLKGNQFKDVCTHVGEFLPGADKGAWAKFGSDLEAALGAAGL